MKEAAGEANMTVITVVLIAIVLGVGTVIIKNLMSTTQKRSCCLSQGGVWRESWGKCYRYCSADKMICGGELPLTCD